jgi:hypothetical protein
VQGGAKKLSKRSLKRSVVATKNSTDLKSRINTKIQAEFFIVRIKEHLTGVGSGIGTGVGAPVGT